MTKCTLVMWCDVMHCPIKFLYVQKNIMKCLLGCPYWGNNITICPLGCTFSDKYVMPCPIGSSKLARKLDEVPSRVTLQWKISDVVPYSLSYMQECMKWPLGFSSREYVTKCPLGFPHVLKNMMRCAIYETIFQWRMCVHCPMGFLACKKTW